MTKGPTRDLDLVARCAREVNTERLFAAIVRVQRKYRIEESRMNTIGLPGFKVTAKRVLTPPRMRPLCGTATGDHLFWLYSPGFAYRRARGFSVKLSVLEAYIHEALHEISGSLRLPGLYKDAGGESDMTRIISGVYEMIDIGGQAFTLGNQMLNEGITQSFALEVMSAYLDMGGFMDVTDAEVRAHFQKIALDQRGTFYPLATDLVSGLAWRIGKVLGSSEAGYGKLYRSYFRGTAVQEDISWMSLFNECGIHDIMQNVRTAEYDWLPVHEALLRGDASRWSGVVIAEDLKPDPVV